MNDQPNNSTNSTEDEINYLDLLIVILKRKKMIIYMTICAAVIAAIISLILPPIYRAETRILPPQQSSMGVLAQMGGGISDLASSALGIKTPSNLYVGMLKSRTIKDKIIQRFNLMELYDKEYPEDTRRKLENRCDISVDKKSGIISVAIEDREPQRAADMANAFVQELKSLSKGLAITEAAGRRLFFEEQLKETEELLIGAEESMKAFQEKTGVMKIEEQARALIEGIAELRALIAAKEVEIKVMKKYSTAQNPELQYEEEALRGMKAELNKLELKGGNGYDPLMPSRRIPEVAVDYVRKLRELKFSETLYGLILQQYELAKIDEARDTVVIQAVDQAIPPQKRIWPKRKLLVMIGIIAGFVMSIVLVFFIEYTEKADNDPETRERLIMLRKYMALKKNKDL